MITPLMLKFQNIIGTLYCIDLSALLFVRNIKL